MFLKGLLKWKVKFKFYNKRLLNCHINVILYYISYTANNNVYGMAVPLSVWFFKSIFVFKEEKTSSLGRWVRKTSHPLPLFQLRNNCLELEHFITVAPYLSHSSVYYIDSFIMMMANICCIDTENWQNSDSNDFSVLILNNVTLNLLKWTGMELKHH